MTKLSERTSAEASITGAVRTFLRMGMKLYIFLMPIRILFANENETVETIFMLSEFCRDRRSIDM